LNLEDERRRKYCRVSSKSRWNCQHNQRTGRIIRWKNSSLKGTNITSNEIWSQSSYRGRSIKSWKTHSEWTTQDFTAYEMRTWQEKPSKGETTFKVSKGTKKHEHVSNERNSDISDEEKENFNKKIKIGSNKHKGKLLFKCFNCGKIGHFVSKCPYPKEEDSDNEENYNHKYHKKDKASYKKIYKNFYCFYSK